eukprot:IDg6414t1
MKRGNLLMFKSRLVRSECLSLLSRATLLTRKAFGLSYLALSFPRHCIVIKVVSLLMYFARCECELKTRSFLWWRPEALTARVLARIDSRAVEFIVRAEAERQPTRVLG